MTDRHRSAPPPGALARLVDSAPFTAFIVCVIVANAVVLGLQTYDDVVARYGDRLPEPAAAASRSSPPSSCSTS